MLQLRSELYAAQCSLHTGCIYRASLRVVSQLSRQTPIGTNIESVSEWEAEAKMKDSSEERREETTTTNEKSEVAVEGIVTLKGLQFS
jgi:hypothetical protein